jgi:hypothetical protein
MTKFSLTISAESNEELMPYIQAQLWIDFAQELNEELRRKAKYGDKPETTWDEVRDLFFSIMKENDLKLP